MDPPTKPIPVPPPMPQNLKLWTCPICATEYKAYGWKTRNPIETSGYNLGAGHEHEIVCQTCIIAWVKAKLEDNCIDIPCIVGKCRTRLEQGRLGTLLSRWDDLRLMTCLAQMADLRYCPVCNAPAFLIPGCLDCECRECGFGFCPTCMLPKHAAMRCSAAVYEADPEVQKRFYSERLCENWKVTHTKKCPQCHAAIEKNEGCSHMTCRACKYEFCWICMQKYQGRYVTGAEANGTKCPCPPLPAAAKGSTPTRPPAAAAPKTPVPAAATVPAAAKAPTPTPATAVRP